MSAGAAWVHESVIISLADRAGGEWSRKVRRRCPRRTTRCCSSDEYSITSVKRAMATSDFKRSEDFIVRAQKLLSRDLPAGATVFSLCLRSPSLRTPTSCPRRRQRPWPVGLGGDVGHFFGNVQSIKPPTLLGICGPLFMSYPAVSNVQSPLRAERDYAAEVHAQSDGADFSRYPARTRLGRHDGKDSICSSEVQPLMMTRKTEGDYSA